MPSTKTKKQLDHDIDRALKGGGLEIGDAEIRQMFQQRGPSGDSTKVAILGDPMYVRRFRMPKWNIQPSVLDTADVAIRHHNELGIPTSKHAHRLRAEYFAVLRGKFAAEHQRLIREAERAYGARGPVISGGMHEDWPAAVKDRIRFVAQGTSTLSNAIRLHEALNKTRSPAFR